MWHLRITNLWKTNTRRFTSNTQINQRGRGVSIGHTHIHHNIRFFKNVSTCHAILARSAELQLYKDDTFTAIYTQERTLLINFGSDESFDCTSDDNLLNSEK